MEFDSDCSKIIIDFFVLVIGILLKVSRRTTASLLHVSQSIGR